MIIIDFSQIVLASIHVSIANFENVELENVQYLCYNIIRNYNKKYRDEYGELIIATDRSNTKIWRKEYFSGYKCRRKSRREKSPLDWDLLFTYINQCIDDLKEYFPYKVLCVDGAEADDIIGYLTHKYGSVGEKTLIVSSDKDFLQLQRYRNVNQYSPHHKKMLHTNNAIDYLKEHIIRGDTGDDIPNILTRMDIFCNPQHGERQKSIFKNKVHEWIKCQSPQDFCNDNMVLRYSQNRKLIDLKCIPDKIKHQIQYEFDHAKQDDGMFMYFLDNNLSKLAESINDFKNSYEISNNLLIF